MLEGPIIWSWFSDSHLPSHSLTGKVPLCHIIGAFNALPWQPQLPIEKRQVQGHVKGKSAGQSPEIGKLGSDYSLTNVRLYNQIRAFLFQTIDTYLLF